MAQRVRFCGIDLGSSALHMACVADPAAPGEPVQLRGAAEPSPSPWVDRCPEAAALGQALAALGQQVGLEARRTPAAVTLPTHAMVLKPVDLPPLSAAERRAALYLEMARIAPVADDDMLGDWLSLAGSDGGEGGSQLHLLMAVPQRSVSAVRCALRLARLRAAAVEPEPATLFRLAQLLANPNSEAAEVMVDLGAGSTRLVVTQRDQLLLFRELPVGGAHLTAALAAHLRVDAATAEELKRTRYRTEAELEAFGAAGERLLSEVERSLRYIEHGFGLDGYGALHLVGGGAHWPFLRRVIEVAVGRRAEEQVVVPLGPVDPSLALAAALALWQQSARGDRRWLAGGGVGR